MVSIIVRKTPWLLVLEIVVRLRVAFVRHYLSALAEVAEGVERCVCDELEPKVVSVSHPAIPGPFLTPLTR